MNVLRFQSGWSRNLRETKIQFANSFLAIRNKTLATREAAEKNLRNNVAKRNRCETAIGEMKH